MRTNDEILSDARMLYDLLSQAEELPGPAEMVLAMGGSDLGVADTAAEAFFQREASWLICTGGYGKDTAGVLPQPEAVLYARRCAALGVPEDRIIVEDRSTNCGENLRFARQLLTERDILPRTGVIACKPYLARRAWATAAKQWPELRWGVACQQIGLEEYLRQRQDPQEVLHLMVGDLQRMRRYAGSFQVPVTVPEPVWEACLRLAADGYDRFVIR